MNNNILQILPIVKNIDGNDNIDYDKMQINALILPVVKNIGDYDNDIACDNIYYENNAN